MADADLTQYNGTPAWVATADVATAADTYLEPTDFKKITALDNGLNKAPVNRALSRIKDLLIGLRGATVGDFAGAVPRVFKSLWVDPTAGGISPSADGDITAYVGNVRAGINSYADGAFVGQLAAVIGLYASATLARLLQYSLQLEGTTTGTFGANPPLATSVKNELRAKNMPKAWGWVSIQAGVVNASSGWGNWTAVTTTNVTRPGKVVTDRLAITLNDAMDNINYSIVAMTVRADGSNMIVPFALTDTRTTGLIDIGFWNLGFNPPAPPAPPFGTYNTWGVDGTFEVTFHIFGQQTT